MQMLVLHIKLTKISDCLKVWWHYFVAIYTNSQRKWNFSHGYTWRLAPMQSFQNVFLQKVTVCLSFCCLNSICIYTNLRQIPVFGLKWYLQKQSWGKRVQGLGIVNHAWKSKAFSSSCTMYLSKSNDYVASKEVEILKTSMT